MHNFLFSEKYYGIDKKFYDIKIEHITFSSSEKQFYIILLAQG